MNSLLQTLTDVLEAHGLSAGLKWLNHRVPHRWTAIYKLDDRHMRNMALIDKQSDTDLGALTVVPLQDSFCQFTMADGKFVSSNTGEDSDLRLNGHAYKGVLNSYVGLPLMQDPDKMYGTLCHFDASPLVVSDEEFEFLQQVARLLPRYLKQHTVPAHVQPL